MNYETDLLNRLYQNAQMGEQSLDLMIKNTRNPRLRQVMQKQKDGYAEFSQKAQRQLHLRKEIPQQTSRMAQMGVTMGVRMNLLKGGRRPSHLAEMLIQGSTMGVIDASQHLNKYRHCVSGQARDLAGDMITFEEKNIERLKSFL